MAGAISGRTLGAFAKHQQSAKYSLANGAFRGGRLSHLIQQVNNAADVIQPAKHNYSRSGEPLDRSLL